MNSSKSQNVIPKLTKQTQNSPKTTQTLKEFHQTEYSKKKVNYMLFHIRSINLGKTMGFTI